MNNNIIYDKVYSELINLSLVYEAIEKYGLISKEELILNEIFDYESLNEGKTSQIVASVSLVASLAMMGWGAKKISAYTGQRTDHNKKAQSETEKILSNPNVLSGVRLSDRQIERITSDIKEYTARGREKTIIGTNPDKIMQVLNKGKELLVDYKEMQNNIYMHSIMVTSLFASTHGTYKSLPANGRYIKVRAKQRWILFYKLVVQKDPVDSEKGLTPAEKEECKQHPKWQLYEKLVENIKKVGTSYFVLWLNEPLAKVTQDILGEKGKPYGNEKVSWCGVTVAAIISDVIAGEQEALDADALTGGEFSSTYKFYNNFMNNEELVYDYSESKELSPEMINEKIKEVLFIGSILTLKGVSSKDYGGHFVMVSNVDYINSTFTTIEGNAGNAMLSEVRTFEEIRTIVNLTSLHGTPSPIVKLTISPEASKAAEELAMAIR